MGQVDPVGGERNSDHRHREDDGGGGECVGADVETQNTAHQREHQKGRNRGEEVAGNDDQPMHEQTLLIQQHA